MKIKIKTLLLALFSIDVILALVATAFNAGTHEALHQFDMAFCGICIGFLLSCD